MAKFLGVQVDENVNQEQQINLVQYKTSENLDIMFKAMKLLELKSLLNFYFSFLKKLSSQKKKLVLRLIFQNSKFKIFTNIFQELDLSIFSMNNIFKTLALMFLNHSSPKIFTFKFQSIVRNIQSVSPNQQFHLMLHFSGIRFSLWQ